MSEAKIRVVATGCRQGKTFKWRSWSFVDGVCEVSGEAAAITGELRYLRVNLQAYPEGSEELDGILQDQPVDGQGQAGAAAPKAPVVVPPADQGQAGTPGGVPDGDGEGAERIRAVAEAVKSLDKNNETHWTGDGRPAVAAVASILNDHSVTRDEIDLALQLS